MNWRSARSRRSWPRTGRPAVRRLRPRKTLPACCRRPAAAGETREAPLPPIRFSSRTGFSRLIESQRRYVAWFPTAVDAPGANPVALRQAGNDVLVTDDAPDRKRVVSAVKSGMFLLPQLTGADAEDGGVQRLIDQISLYPLPQSVALWSIGEHLGVQRELAGARSKSSGSARRSSPSTSSRRSWAWRRPRSTASSGSMPARRPISTSSALTCRSGAPRRRSRTGRNTSSSDSARPRGPTPRLCSGAGCRLRRHRSSRGTSGVPMPCRPGARPRCRPTSSGS